MSRKSKPEIPEILPPTNDWVFKLLFGDERNKDNLIALLKSFVELPDEEFELIFLDTHLKPEAEDDKLGILDVKVKTRSGKIVNVEIQIKPKRDIIRKGTQESDKADSCALHCVPRLSTNPNCL